MNNFQISWNWHKRRWISRPWKKVIRNFLELCYPWKLRKKSGRHSFPFAIFTRNFKLFGPVQVLLKKAPKNLENIADFRTVWNLTSTFPGLKNIRFSKNSKGQFWLYWKFRKGKNSSLKWSSLQNSKIDKTTIFVIFREKS